MVFKEKTSKVILQRLRRPVCTGARFWTFAAIVMLILSVFTLVSFVMILAPIFGILAIIFGAIAFNRTFMNGRYGNKIEINGRDITFSCYTTDPETKRAEKMTMRVLELKGIEYYTQTKEIAFLGPVDYGHTKLYGVCTEDIYDDSLLEYLQKNVMNITYIRKGSFAEKWRS